MDLLSDLQPSVLFFAAVIPMMAAVFGLRFVIRRLFAGHRAKLSNRTAFIIETIMGEKIVKTYNQSERCEDIYKEVHQASIRQWMKIVSVLLKYILFFYLLTYVNLLKNQKFI